MVIIYSICFLQTTRGRFNASEVLTKLDTITKGRDSQTGDLISVSSVLQQIVQRLNISDTTTDTTQVTDVRMKTCVLMLQKL